MIPKEYLTLRSSEDFGFSAVDEAEVNHVVDENTLETKLIRETVSTSNEAVARIEDKLDSILVLYNQGKLGLDAEREKLEQESKAKLAELEALIVPLMINLMKNPEKEYLYWPGRKEKVQEQLNKILAITRGTTE
jgi:predicted lipoprotein